MKFTDFVVFQVDRLGAIAEFASKISEAGQREIAEWLLKAAAETKPDRKLGGGAEWLRESEAARQVRQVIDECVEFASPPSLADIAQVWRRLFPPLNEVRGNCEYCGGSGYRALEGEYGISGAYPCTHRPMSEADYRMGVRMAPAVAKMYAEEMGEGGKAEQRVADWRANPYNPMNAPPKSRPVVAPLRRITREDMNGC